MGVTGEDVLRPATKLYKVLNPPQEVTYQDGSKGLIYYDKRDVKVPKSPEERKQLIESGEYNNPHNFYSKSTLNEPFWMPKNAKPLIYDDLVREYINNKNKGLIR